METTSLKPQLPPERMERATDYVELVWQGQASEKSKAALAEFHRRRPRVGAADR
ncbi:hypothetical protein ACFYO5_24330 [Streptomyces sp. NPDC006259]|uniref:hypothetical protein n=1 Tax=Streptomyces sp. NPDC006259 TaxID=3364740 RepID=UPI0036C886BA